ncbi:mannanase [Sistotremastrum suecicum HHB10207 ss-3]|uniref:mannan endo-1,4-beta-mannosidase n=1 Tax=Sistotremastrum suecicum HHB10207 ss-3 TaxID=1314776 RepID=A0A166DX05_9AGAM|nr:mannanase [Sistotremastrum suecicum HHB10207 ss-3]
MFLKSLASLAAVAVAVSAQAPNWGQCGGIGWSGATTCAGGWVCTYSNPYYSQCLAPSSTSTKSTTTTTSTTSKSTTTTTTKSTSTTTTTSTTSKSTTTSSTSTSTPPASTGFVGVSGQKFTLNGATYTVAGTNAYWLAQYSNADIDQAFSDIAAAGLTTVRTWGFNEVTSIPNYGAYYQSWSNGVPTINTGSTGLGKFDYVVSSAKAHGIRLVVTLTNNWSDYGGMDVYVSQLNPGGTHDTFYTNTKIIAAYKSYINTWVSRYKNEPTIMAWELANEPRCSGSSGSASSACVTTGATINQWASTISAYIKSLDSNHLVALGDEGWFQEANPPTYPYAPGVGIDFNLNLKISTLDYGTFHSYPESWGQTANESAWGVQWIIDHAASQKSANKPVVLEEFGVTNNQATIYQSWLNTVVSSGLTGEQIWQAGSNFPDGTTYNDGYAVYPGSAVYTLIEQYAATLKSRG